MPDELFLDTEWANDACRELVSLALVNADGSRRFYAERDPLPGAPSSFVRTIVYPLLERGAAAVPDHIFAHRLREFIASFDNPRIHFDGQLDKVQLMQALSCFGRSKEDIPPFTPILVTRQDVLDELELYFARDPKACARRHHAAVDAEALRFAFMNVLD